MKKVITSKITFVALLAGLFISCKNNDGYSDEVQTNQNTVATDSSANQADSLNANSTGPAGKSTIGGTGDKGAGNTGAESLNAGSTTSGSTDKDGALTGTGTGPGPSAKDGSAYAGPSDPQNIKDTANKTKKNKAEKIKN